eukprot:746530-Hanusia_phi.AAC.1
MGADRTVCRLVEAEQVEILLPLLPLQRIQAFSEFVPPPAGESEALAGRGDGVKEEGEQQRRRRRRRRRRDVGKGVAGGGAGGGATGAVGCKVNVYKKLTDGGSKITRLSSWSFVREEEREGLVKSGRIEGQRDGGRGEGRREEGRRGEERGGERRRGEGRGGEERRGEERMYGGG